MKNHRSIKNNHMQYIVLSALISSLILLQGCATSVSRLSNDGKSDEIIFPQIEKNTWMKEGTFPNLDNLRNVAPDMTKNQVYALLGHPHFSEGIGKIREWDYIFNFRENDNNLIDGKSIQTCQYKIIYNPSMRLQNTYWKPESCAQQLNIATAKTDDVVLNTTEVKTIEKIVPSAALTKLQLSADGMFDFDRSAMVNLRPGGVEKLDRLASNLLAGGEITTLNIIGHTDRLGDDAYNVKLSQARAETIKQYLMSKNIPAERISASGAGKSMPIVECNQSKRDDKLIRCLEPNRRFEIEAWTIDKT
ncbi:MULTISPECIES: OmpA family protein [Methylotenera]|uniref:OmpA family protein n=1 Tax=Methylotenera TaxID=359407 RepID=UPI00036C94AC|nr:MULTISPECIES: OmpA family protein [Methylotenera]